jgi:hypothetical protein
MPSLLEILLLLSHFIHSILLFWSEVDVLRHFALSFFGPSIIGASHWYAEGEQDNVLIIYVAATLLRIAIKIAAFDIWVLGTLVSWTDDAKMQDTLAQEEVEVKDTQEPEEPQEPQEPGQSLRPVTNMIAVCGDGPIS